MPSEEEIEATVKWYEAVPDDFKRYVAFRYERMKDEAFSEFYELLALAKRLAKAWRKRKNDA